MGENKKHYHKGIKCQLGFHKWEKTGARIVMDGKAGELIAKVCCKCGFKNGKGYFIVDPIKKDEATKISIDKSNLSPYTEKTYTGGGGGSVSSNGQFIKKGGFVIKDGIKRKMTEADMKKFEREMGNAIVEIKKAIKGMGVRVGSVSSNNENFMSSIIALPSSPKGRKLIVNGLEMMRYCTCEDGKWNESGSHCKACKREVRT